jgi:hypothetical protein
MSPGFIAPAVEGAGAAALGICLPELDHPAIALSSAPGFMAVRPGARAQITEPTVPDVNALEVELPFASLSLALDAAAHTHTLRAAAPLPSVSNRVAKRGADANSAALAYTTAVDALMAVTFIPSGLHAGAREHTLVSASAVSSAPKRCGRRVEAATLSAAADVIEVAAGGVVKPRLAISPDNAAADRQSAEEFEREPRIADPLSSLAGTPPRASQFVIMQTSASVEAIEPPHMAVVAPRLAILPDNPVARQRADNPEREPRMAPPLCSAADTPPRAGQFVILDSSAALESIGSAYTAVTAPRLTIAPETTGTHQGATSPEREPHIAAPLCSVADTPPRAGHFALVQAAATVVEPAAPAPAISPLRPMPLPTGLRQTNLVGFEIGGAPPSNGKPELEPFCSFGALFRLRPDLTPELPLLDEHGEPLDQTSPKVDGAAVITRVAAASAGAEPHSQPTPHNKEPEPADVSPRSVLQALAQMKVELQPAGPGESDGPPLRTALKPLLIPGCLPASAVLAGGFESAPLSAKPRLLRYTLQPLRPKMAVGSADGPLGARSNGVRLANGRKPHLDAPKSMPKSMLHLEDDAGADDGETVSLFGRIGGLFGRKNRSV